MDHSPQREDLPLNETEPASKEHTENTAIVERVHEKIAGFSSGPLKPLWRNLETTTKYFPSAEELEGLSQKDRETTLRFIGRVSAALEAGMFSGSERWVEAFARECANAFAVAEERSSVERLVEKFSTLVALHIAAEKNSNMSGYVARSQNDLCNALIAQLETKNETRAIDALVDPFHFVPGESYFVRERDDKGHLFLNEKFIGEVIIDGINSAIDVDGATIRLFDFNRRLFLERAILRDGRNYFGGCPALPEEIASLNPGEHIELLYKLPNDQDLIFPCEYLGSNEKTLGEKYGAAFLPYAKDLLLLRIQRKDAGHDGEEAEVPYRDIAAVRKKPK